MEYQKIINLLENAPNQLTKFRTKTWVEMINDSCAWYIAGCQVRFKTSMLRSSL